MFSHNDLKCTRLPIVNYIKLYTMSTLLFLDLAPCYSNPCEHGGHCVPIDGGKSYHCYCGPYWTGDRCQCKYFDLIFEFTSL